MGGLNSTARGNSGAEQGRNGRRPCLINRDLKGNHMRPMHMILRSLSKINDSSGWSHPRETADHLSRIAAELYAVADAAPGVLPYVPPDEDKPNPTAWPKKCPTCAREFTPVTWPCLRLRGYVGHFQAQGSRLAVELRDCICTSTIGIEVPLPMAVTP